MGSHLWLTLPWLTFLNMTSSRKSARLPISSSPWLWGMEPLLLFEPPLTAIAHNPVIRYLTVILPLPSGKSLGLVPRTSL